MKKSKLLRKIGAVVMASALAFSSMTVSAGQDASALADGTAYLNINNADWGEFEAEWTNAEITGDGSYTVAMKATEPQKLAQFNALEVVNGEATLGTGCVLTVDSIKINGEEVELQGPSYTCSADGGGVTTRVNIYNEWNAPDATAVAGDDNHADHRVAEGNLEDATAMLFTNDYVDSSSGSGFEVSELEVNFTVSGYGTTGAAGQAAAVTAEGPAIAHLVINNADWTEYEAEYVDAEITGDGTYTVSMTASEGQKLAQFNALQVENGELLMGTECVLTVDEIKINGEVVELQGPSYTCSADGGGVTTRVNLYNEWNAPDATAVAGDDNHADHRVAEGNLEDATAMLFTNDYVDSSSGSGFEVTSMEVTFTVSNYGAAAAAGAAVAEETVPFDASGVYHAYIGFQSPTYTFRNAWDGDDGYGNDTPEFNQITGWDESNNAVAKDGTLNDTEIAGNGTYKVSVTGVDLANDFGSQDYMNLIFFSTDIPKGAPVTFSDVVLTINNSKQLNISNFVVSEDNTCLRLQIQNIWDTENGIDTLEYYPTPVSDIEIQFTVAGFDYDNAVVEEPAAAETSDDASAETTEQVEEPKAEKKGLSGGAIAGIVAGVVVVAGAGVGIGVASKKKND